MTGGTLGHVYVHVRIRYPVGQRRPRPRQRARQHYTALCMSDRHISALASAAKRARSAERG